MSDDYFNTTEGGQKSQPSKQDVKTVSQKQSDGIGWLSESVGKESRRPKLTHHTLKQFCTHHKISIRYNVIAKEIEISIPDQIFPIENRYALAWAWIYSELKHLGFTDVTPTTLDASLLLLSCGSKDSIYNPVGEWILSKSWDDKKRFKSLYDTIDAKDNATKEAFMFRWMIGAVAAVFEPEGVSLPGILVLQGKDNLGKTYWIRRLVPEQLCEYVKTGLPLDPHQKDSVKAVVSHWIVELGEIDGIIRKGDIAAIKSFITEQYDLYRPHYGKHIQKMPRRTAFAASVNPQFFLVDPDGNRRFWVIECLSVDSYHTLDMQQIWAEAYVYYKQGEKWALTDKEYARVNEINLDHQVLDYATEKVSAFYNWNFDCTEWKSASEIADQVGIKNPTPSDLTKIGQRVLKLNGGLKKRTTTQRLLAVPTGY